jgi:hypothetical protein
MKNYIFWDITPYSPLKIKQLAICFALVYSSTTKMETVRSSETSVGFQRTKESYIPEDRTLRKGR